MIAQVAMDKDGVLDVIAIEGYGILAYGRGEGILQQADTVVVDINIGKDIVQDSIEDIARLKQVINPRRVDTHDDGALVPGLTTVKLLLDRLLDGDRQDEPVVIGAELHLFEEPGLIPEKGFLHPLRRYLVDGQRQFLVFVILVEVAIGEVGTVLGSNHLTHQLDSGVVLTAVTAATGLHIDIRQPLRTVEPLRGVGIYIWVQLSLQRQTRQKQREKYRGLSPTLHQPHSHPSRGERFCVIKVSQTRMSNPRPMWSRHRHRLPCCRPSCDRCSVPSRHLGHTHRP